MDSKTQKSLMEAAVSVVAPKQVINESTEAHAQAEQEFYAEIAENYITSILGNQLNESTEEERTQLVANLIEQTNLVCYAVNSYFGLQD